MNIDVITGINKIIFEYCYFPRVFEKELIYKTMLIDVYVCNKMYYRDYPPSVIKKHDVHGHWTGCWTICSFYYPHSFMKHFKCEFKSDL